MKNKRKILKNINTSKTLNSCSSMPILSDKLRKNKSRMPSNNILNDYNHFSSLIEKTMKEYKVNNSIPFDDDEEKKNSLLSSKKYVSREEEQYIKKITHLNKSQGNIINNENAHEDNLFKISIKKNARYLSPVHSLGILKLNYKIYDDVTKSNLNRLKFKFDESIKNIEAYHMKYKVKMPKIRITSINPKIEGEIPIVVKKRESVINKKSINFISDISFPNKQRFFSYYRYPNINFPECREQFTLNLNGNYAFLTGGMCTVMKQINVWALNIQTLVWTKLKLNNITSNRFGHTCVIDREKNKLIIFGGRTKILPSNNSNNFICTNSGLYCGLDIFNLNTGLWISPYYPNRNNPKLRRNHICELIGSNMVIHGGITENNEILNDCYMLNINLINYNSMSNRDKDYSDYNNKENDKWNKLSVISYSKSPYLFGHSATLVLPSEIINNSKFSIYKFPESSFGFIKKDKNKNKEISIKGWYIFGGKTKSDSNYGISNELYILKVGMRPCEWIKCENTIGNKPCPRYFHSMNYFENGHFIIIHGGRNDSKSDTFALNDTFILNLENLNWIQVELFSQNDNFNVFSRCGHSSVIYDDKLIICGGMNNNNYLGSALLIVNLDGTFNPFIKTSDFFLNYINYKKKEISEEKEKNPDLSLQNNNNSINQDHNTIDTNLPYLK